MTARILLSCITGESVRRTPEAWAMHCQKSGLLLMRLLVLLVFVGYLTARLLLSPPYIWTVSAVEQFLAPVVLFGSIFIANAIYFRARRRYVAEVVARDYDVCEKCGYALKTHQMQDKCSECGADYDLVSLRKTWKEWCGKIGVSGLEDAD